MQILVLDGGMGTTLEAQGHDVSTPMWGCELVHRDPAVIQAVHSGYANAGADLISTATYQLTREALMAQGHSATVARDIMHKAVALAIDAAANSEIGTGVVLALGPFGATMSPGQEYAGFYPPPYGPSGFSADSTNTNYSSDPEAHISALAHFHLDRLRIYAAHPSWEHIRWVAFETIPTTAEMHGVRRAMATLAAEGRGKKFWISSAFPDGKPGQLGPDGRPVDISEVVSAMLAPVDGEATPRGVGINCTNPGYLSGVVGAYTAELNATKGMEDGGRWLVVYPDGGSVYDVVTRSWSDAQRVSPDKWAAGLVGAVSGQQGWAGAIVGGCCKSSFAEVAALRAVVHGQEQ